MRPTVDELENALHIPQPQSAQLQVVDTRRLTGPGLLWDKPGAIIEIKSLGLPTSDVERCWARQARRVLDAVGWQRETLCCRPHEDGFNLAISAPVDQLYSAIFVVQFAWHCTACEVLGTAPAPFETWVSELLWVMKREANPRLIALQGAAAVHNIDFISDDDDVSLGHGCGSKTWSVDDLPDPKDIDWSLLHDIPVAMITGTNGKTTCVRLASALVKAQGKVAGVTSTDFVRVGDDILDYGDYSGPGGARMLLRDKRLEIALLEVARGGILRRGLALRRAQAVLITNVAADHLGQYGINTVAALTEVKFSVFRTLAPGGVLVLNADDEGLVHYAQRLAAEVTQFGRRICWFSLDKANVNVRAAVEDKLPCAWVDDAALWYFDGSHRRAIVPVKDIPITMGGAAEYNIQNALGVMCLGFAFGLSQESICRGLSIFTSSAQDNPGRCNEFVCNGARIFVDFAHNRHSIDAVAKTMKNLPAKRRILLLGHAGDRSDEEIRALTSGAFSFLPDHVIISEIPDYLRGRASGEVSDIIRNECLRGGLEANQLSYATDPLAGTEQALERLGPGDLALLLILSHRDQVIELLSSSASD